jgi:hypothetical protein
MTALKLKTKFANLTPPSQSAAAPEHFHAMANDNETLIQKTDTATNLFRLVVPVLLGAILTYAFNINAAQVEQGKQLSSMQGQIGVIGQQNGDTLARVGKLEAQLDTLNRGQAINSGRLLVLETARHFK